MRARGVARERARADGSLSYVSQDESSVSRHADEADASE